MSKMPASGGATVLSPGRNLATSSDRAPCLAKTPSVRRTHESGSSEIRQRNSRIRIPLRRPSSYQRKSAMSAPSNAINNDTPKLRCPEPASAPAARRSGTEGIGKPSCSASTQANTRNEPCFKRKAMALCMENGSTFDSILTNERRWFAPCARHDKLRQGLAAARRHLRLSQLFGQPVGITRIADRERGNRFPSRGNLKHFPRLVGVEPGHLVYCQSARRPEQAPARFSPKFGFPPSGPKAVC